MDSRTRGFNMTTVVPITDLEMLRLALMRTVNNDPAAYKEAAAFVQDSQLKLELFNDCFHKVMQHNPQYNTDYSTQAVSAAKVAVTEAEQRYAVISA